jgi:hypothetical protein
VTAITVVVQLVVTGFVADLRVVLEPAIVSAVSLAGWASTAGLVAVADQPLQTVGRRDVAATNLGDPQMHLQPSRGAVPTAGWTFKRPGSS